MAIQKPKKISTANWIKLFGLTIAIDIGQILADLTGVGIAASVAIEPFVGVSIVVICQKMGINVITNVKRMGSLLASTGLDTLTGGLAPFWVVDIWYIYYDKRKEEAAEQVAYDEEINTQNMLSGIQQPLYKNGERQPQYQQQDTTLPETSRNQNFRPLVVDGVRASRK